ncbi:mediator of RNA polymerase II transcription subunit 22-like isoform X1 [Artemia franciscana]|uniref:mediator of RNA polymerase II transcription subunit 22-like isoform X1 n=1 Tax=Artemia franciscana TaxID=6661 RepID=UPI0032DAA43B
MAQTRSLQTKEALLKSFSKRLKDDIKSMLENFGEIVKLAKVEEEGQVSRMTQCEEEQFEMLVRAANMVRAGESLMKLVASLKEYLILNDVKSLNDAISNRTSALATVQRDSDKKLMVIRDEMATDLYDLEEDYYSSLYKSIDAQSSQTEAKK